MVSIKSVAVIGGGIMGGGIAQVAMTHSYDVLLVEQNAERLAAGLQQIRGRLARDVERGRLSQEGHDRALARLNGSTELAELIDCDLVIEAVTEDLGVKQVLFRELGSICKDQTILASNTSSISLSALAGVSGRPEQVIGLHFFNPPTALKLVEVITSSSTSEATIEAAMEFCDRVDRVTVRATDSPGFIVNRLLVPFIFDAIRMVESGIAEASDIDQACRVGLNHAMGPLATADLIGLDTLAHIGDSMFEEFGEPRFKPPGLVRRMTSLGTLGRKTGCGFFPYE